MLQGLSIRNFAIIDELELEFKPDFNVLSGETGAGKSILIQALGLIQGERGYSDLIRSGENECEVKAIFNISCFPQVLQFLSERGHAVLPQLTLRRILQRSGKGKVWINDRTCSVGDLAALSFFLLDVVSQHESQTLLTEEMPRKFLDDFGVSRDILEDYQKNYQHYLNSQNELQALERRLRESQEKEDLYRFQLREIGEAALKKGEEEEILQEKNILAHAVKLSEAVAGVERLLYSANGSVTELLGRSLSALSKISGIDPALDQQTEILKVKGFELEDVIAFFQNYLKKVEVDPHRLTSLETRLDQISKLKKKYGGSIETILEKESDLEKAVQLLDHSDEERNTLQENFIEAKKILTVKAEKLTLARKKAAKDLAACMEKELQTLAMVKSRFEVRVLPFTEEERFKSTGADQIEFLISPNVGEDPKPLALVASGGELSRVLLALKSVLRRPQAIGAFIFDEVDTGIGGAVAEVVGQKLKKLALSSQVICITHLPQIAAYAQSHFQICKKEKKQRTITEVKLLEGEERETEIARMLAGIKITAEARLHARQLIEGACPERSASGGESKGLK